MKELDKILKCKEVMLEENKAILYAIFPVTLYRAGTLYRVWSSFSIHSMKKADTVHNLIYSKGGII